MQLTKLLTLIQFIDQCEGDFAQCYLSINKYNNFIKQPLTKEMFVGDDAIFEGWEESVCIEGIVNNVNNIDFIDFDNDCACYNGDFDMDTLFDLSVATKGTLTLKNVEI